jgi:hypothetical protein
MWLAPTEPGMVGFVGGISRFGERPILIENVILLDGVARFMVVASLWIGSLKRSF